MEKKTFLVYYDPHEGIEFVLEGDLAKENPMAIIAREMPYTDEPDLELIYTVEGLVVDGKPYFPLSWYHTAPTLAEG